MHPVIEVVDDILEFVQGGLQFIVQPDVEGGDVVSVVDIINTAVESVDAAEVITEVAEGVRHRV